MNMKLYKRIITMTIMGSLVLFSAASASGFDHEYSDYNRLLKAHVVWINDGKASRVDYAALKKDRESLQSVLDDLSAVGRDTYDSWEKPKRLAFLINAYNAFTLELILTKYPDLKSIKELGSLFTSAWKKEFFTLLGKKRHLDWVEHGMIRKKGVFNEPRIHFAVNCASIGCPALRDEAYVYERLEEQLEDQKIRFLTDRSRNRYDAKDNELQVSKIFDWYKEDFERGWRGYDSRTEFFAKNATYLADEKENVNQIRNKEVVDISFLDYDWDLNDVE